MAFVETRDPAMSNALCLQLHRVVTQQRDPRPIAILISAPKLSHEGWECCPKSDSADLNTILGRCFDL